MVLLADQVSRVELDFEMQAVVGKQQGGRRSEAALEADEFVRLAQVGDAVILQFHFEHDVAALVGEAVLLHHFMTAALERYRLIQELIGVAEYRLATHRVVGGSAGSATGFGYHIGTVERIEQAAPACIGGVEGVAGVHHRYYQLRAGADGDFIVVAAGADLVVLAHRYEVADVLQEAFVFVAVRQVVAGIVAFVPRINMLLQLITLLQQGTIARRQCVDNPAHGRPECFRLDAGARRCFLLDEVVEHLGDLQVAGSDIVRHAVLLFCATALKILGCILAPFNGSPTPRC